LARDNGILHPSLVALAAIQVGLPYAAACALLVRESGGGKNEWGHDPTIFIGGGDYGQPVTEESYTAYKAERDQTGKMQGVGPCQLTWKGYQDAADALGGCWIPFNNMVIGFGILRGYRDAGLSWHEAWKRYNGSDAYADAMDVLYAEWKQLLNP
jgi:hypothetical protein